MTPATLLPYAIVPFVLWRVYARIKRLTTRQQSRPVRHWISALLFPAIVVLLAMASLFHPLSLAALGAGVAVGAGLGVIGLQKTRYENLDGTLFYTPNAHIGIFVSLLFVGRLLMRMVDIFVNHVPPNDNMAKSPTTMLVFGVLAGYYMLYSAGLLRYRRAHGIK